MVGVSIYQSGRLGFEPCTFHLFQKCGMLLACYQLVPPVPPTSLAKAVPYVLSCLYDNARARSLAIFCQSRSSCLITRLVTVPI